MPRNVDINAKFNTGELSKGVKKAKGELDSLKGAGKSAGENLRSYTTKIKREIGEATGLVGKFSTAIQVGMGTVAGIAMTRLLARVADFTTAMIAAPVQIGAAFEQVETDFKVFLGSLEAAKMMVKDINNLAAETPMQSADLLQSAKMLMSFGVETNKILPTLKMLGEITGGNAERFKMLTLAFSQTTAAGKLMGNDLLQMVNAGVSIKDLAGAMGLTVGQFQKMKEEGKITSEMITKAFEKITSEGGRFFGRMKEQSQTTLGLFSTLKDNLTLFGNAIGQFLLPSIKALLKDWIALTQNLTQSASTLLEIEQATGKFSKAIKDLALIIGATAGGFGLVAAIQALGKAYASLFVITARTTAFQVALAYVLKGELTLALMTARNAVIALTTSLLANPYFLVGAGVIALTTAIIAYNRAQKSELDIANEKIEKFITTRNNISPLIDEYEKLRTTTKRTADEEKRFSDLQSLLSDTFPTIRDGLNNNKSAVAALAEEYNKLRKSALEAKKAMLIAELQDVYKKNTPSPLPNEGFLTAEEFAENAVQAWKNIFANPLKAQEEAKEKLLEIKKLNLEIAAIDLTSGAKTGNEVKPETEIDEKALKKYEDFSKKLADERFSIETNRLAQERLNQSSINIEEEYEKEILALTVKYAKAKRDIELSEALNKNELIQRLEYNFVLESQDLINKIRKESYQKALEQEVKEMKEAEKQKRELRKLYNESMRDDIDLNLKDILASYKFNKLEELKLTKQAEEAKLKYIDITTKEYKEQLIVIKEIEQQIKDNQDRIDQNFNEHLRNLASNANLASGILRDLAKAGADAVSSLSDSITGSLSTAIQDFMNKNQTLGEALKSFFENIKRAIVKMIADMIAEMVKLYILQPLLENMFKNFLQNTKQYSEAIGSVGNSFVKIAASAPAASMGVTTLSTAQKVANPILQNSKQPMEEIGKSYEKLASESKKAALSVAQLAVSQAAYSVALIPFVGGFLAPAAAAATGAGIAAGAAVATAGLALSNILGGFFADGGRPPVGIPSVVGEKGPELFVPDRAGTIIPNNKLSSASGGGSKGSDQVNYVYAPQIKTGANADEVFQVLDKHSKQFFAKVQEGIEINSGLRNAVRGTR